jgi:hypothetical protein
MRDGDRGRKMSASPIGVVPRPATSGSRELLLLPALRGTHWRISTQDGGDTQGVLNASRDRTDRASDGVGATFRL